MQADIVVGCGYLGKRLLHRLGGPVRAFTGSDASAAALRSAGIDASAWNLDLEDATRRVDAAGANLLYLAPPAPGAPRDQRLRRCLAALAGTPRRLLYVSTTGVYGDTGGGTVTEDMPLAPGTGRARARVDAEQALVDWAGARGAPWVILRVPGIYGPGRLPLVQLDRGDPVLHEAEAGPGNRIHVDDLATVCLAAATLPVAANRVYNVGDGNPASRTAYFETVARLAGRPAPERVARAEAQARLSAVAWSYLAESRRVDTTRMREELGVRLAYADLEAGVRASLQQGSDAALSPPGV